MSSNYAEFKEKIYPFLEDWESIDVRITAIYFKNCWFFRGINIILDQFENSDQIEKTLPNTENLLVIHQRLGIDQFENLLHSISSGELNIDDQTVIIKQYSNDTFNSITNPQLRFYPRKEAKSRFGIDYATHALQVWHSQELREITSVCNNELGSYCPPWDGLPDLYENFVGFTKEWAIRKDSSNLQILAPLFVRLNDVTLEKKKLRVTIDKSKTIENDVISLSLISQYPDETITRESKKFHNNTFTKEYENEPSKITVLLSYRDIITDRIERYGLVSNKRIQVFQHLKGDLSEFIENFRKNGRRLEVKCALLFHMLGFSSAHYGYGTDSVPDLLAFHDADQKVLVIECTQREIDVKNKLSKLSTRCKEIQRIIGDSEILPIIVTGFESSLINQSDLDIAEKENIVVISHEGIQDVVKLSLEGATSSELYSYFADSRYDTFSIGRKGTLRLRRTSRT